MQELWSSFAAMVVKMSKMLNEKGAQMTPDRQQLKEALEVINDPTSDLSKDKAWEMLCMVCQAAQAWYDLPDKLEGMKRSCGGKRMEGLPVYNRIQGYNTAIDEIKEMVKSSPE